MIRVGKYGIDTSERCYAVGIVSTYKNKNTGKETEILTGAQYYSDLPAALKSLIKRNRLETLREFDGDLKAAVKAISEADNELERLIKEAIP